MHKHINFAVATKPKKFMVEAEHCIFDRQTKQYHSEKINSTKVEKCCKKHKKKRRFSDTKKSLCLFDLKNLQSTSNSNMEKYGIYPLQRVKPVTKTLSPVRQYATPKFSSSYKAIENNKKKTTCKNVEKGALYFSSMESNDTNSSTSSLTSLSKYSSISQLFLDDFNNSDVEKYETKINSSLSLAMSTISSLQISNDIDENQKNEFVNDLLQIGFPIVPYSLPSTSITNHIGSLTSGLPIKKRSSEAIYFNENFNNDKQVSERESLLFRINKSNNINQNNLMLKEKNYNFVNKNGKKTLKLNNSSNFIVKTDSHSFKFNNATTPNITNLKTKTKHMFNRQNGKQCEYNVNKNDQYQDICEQNENNQNYLIYDKLNSKTYNNSKRASSLESLILKLKKNQTKLSAKSKLNHHITTILSNEYEKQTCLTNNILSNSIINGCQQLLLNDSYCKNKKEISNFFVHNKKNSQSLCNLLQSPLIIKEFVYNSNYQQQRKDNIVSTNNKIFHQNITKFNNIDNKFYQNNSSLLSTKNFNSKKLISKLKRKNIAQKFYSFPNSSLIILTASLSISTSSKKNFCTTTFKNKNWKCNYNHIMINYCRKYKNSLLQLLFNQCDNLKFKQDKMNNYKKLFNQIFLLNLLKQKLIYYTNDVNFINAQYNFFKCKKLNNDCKYNKNFYKKLNYKTNKHHVSEEFDRLSSTKSVKFYTSVDYDNEFKNLKNSKKEFHSSFSFPLRSLRKTKNINQLTHSQSWPLEAGKQSSTDMVIKRRSFLQNVFKIFQAASEYFVGGKRLSLCDTKFKSIIFINQFTNISKSK